MRAKEFLIENKAQQLANEFMSAYGTETENVYYNMKDAVLAIISDYKSFSRKAADLFHSFKSMPKDEFEEWIILSFVPFLKDQGFPKPFSTEWGKAQDEFRKGFIN